MFHRGICIYVYEKYLSVVFLQCLCFGYYDNADFINEVGSIPSAEIVENWYNLYLKYLVGVTMNPSRSGAYSFGRLLIISSI